MTARRATTAAVVALLGVLVLAGCSGIPRASAPEIVSPVRLAAPPGAPTISPAPDADPQTIVAQFLSANSSTDVRHSAARAFLTQDAQRRWSDATVTVVADAVKVSAATPTVTVAADRIGTVDEDGVYSPDLVGNGASGNPLSIQFVLRRVSGQWRIDQLPNGLIVTQTEFADLYQPQRVYFLDPSESLVVPDLRYSALAQPGDLASWLASQLAAGPRPFLQNAVQDEVPEQADPRRVSATVTASTVSVEIPGAAQLDARTAELLAAQVTTTLDQAVPGALVTITDGGRPISVPDHPGGATATDFSAFLPQSNAAPGQLYFLNGAVLQTLSGDRAVPVPGALSRPGEVTSAAVSRVGAPNNLVAAVTGVPGSSRLLVGRLTDATLADAGLPPGTLTRPAWAPTSPQPEVWVGSGSSVVRVQVGARLAASTVSLTARSGAVTGAIGAVAFSADGTRVALVVASAQGRGQVWVGAVVRSGAQVRVDGLQPVTPPDVSVDDVAWNDPTTMFVTGTDASSGSLGIWDVQSDGSLWTSRDVAGLPAAPTAITAALEAFPVVQADGRLWQQRRSTWVPLYGSGVVSVPGTSPSYLQ